jgi:glycosyltransferase involved in cell wall biosynthesis
MSIPALAPQISVIVPTFRGDAWITDCLDALAAQTLGWEAFEVVVVMNGPRTATPEIVATWLEAHPGFRLHLIESERPGASRARNLGLDVATGTYVTFVDDDDRIGQRMLEVLLDAAGPDIIPVAPVAFIGEDGKGGFGAPEFENWYTSELLRFVGRPAGNFDLYMALTLVCGKLVPLEVARAVRFQEDLAIAEDRVFWIEVLAHAPLSIELVPFAADAAYLYWIRGDSALRREKGVTWDGTVVPWLTVARRMIELEAPGRQVDDVRRRALASALGNFVRSYVAQHPEDLHRVDAELAAIGLAGDPLLTVAHRILAREVVFLGAQPETDASGALLADRLAERGTLVDVASYLPVGTTEPMERRLASAIGTVDRRIATTGPIQPDWDTLAEFVQYVNDDLAEDAPAKPGPLREVRSVSTAPFEHLAAAFFKIGRPGVRWTAECAARSSRSEAAGAATVVLGDARLQALGGAFLEAGFSLEELPDDAERLAELAILGLADAIVFDDAQQAEAMLQRCEVPEIVARARCVMTLRQRVPVGRPQLSVIVHARPDSTGREACLASLAKQSLHPDRYEILVEEEGDTATALNRGIDAARGDFVTFIDADDAAGLRLLEQLIAKASPATVGVAALGFAGTGARPDLGNPYTAPLAPYAGRLASDQELAAAALTPWAKVLPTDVARRVRFDPALGAAAAPEFWTRVLADGRVRLALTELAGDAAYVHSGSVRPLLARLERPASDAEIQAQLDAVAAVAGVATADVRLRMFQEELVAQLFGVLRAHTRAFPDELGRVDAAVRARGFADVPWQVLHEGAATTFALLGPEPAAAQALAERAGYADVLAFARPDTDLAAVLAPAELVVDQLAAVPTGPGPVDLNAAASETLAMLQGVVGARGRGHAALYSCSAEPLEHLVMALVKLGLPDVPWHAQFLPRSGAITPVALDAEVRQLLHSGLAAAGHADTVLPEDPLDLARVVAAILGVDGQEVAAEPTALTAPTAVAVMGSCITRDSFNSLFNPGYRDLFECPLHQNQTSLISLMDRPVEVTWAPTGEMGDYDRWNVQTEFDKSFLRNVVELAPRLLVIDFFAEIHFGVVRLSSGEYVTDNRWKIRPTDAYQRWQREPGFTRVSWEDDEEAFVALWRRAFDRFVAFVRAELPDTTLVLHRGHNTNILELEDGRRVPLNTHRDIAPLDVEAANRVWASLDDYAASYVDAVIDLRDRTYATFDAHPWKAFYVHYSMDYYRRFLKELGAIAERVSAGLAAAL